MNKAAVVEQRAAIEPSNDADSSTESLSQRIAKAAAADVQGLTFYLTHDNGGRPYKVVLNDNEPHRVVVYKQPAGVYRDPNIADPEHPNTYIDLVRTFDDVKQVLVGEDPVEPAFKGNSVLLSMPEGRYVFVGDHIYEFNTPDGDVIRQYWSSVGNSDVPYPVALGDSYAYFMLEPAYVPRSSFRPDVDWSNGYDDFYGNSRDPFYGANFGGFHRAAQRVPGHQVLVQRFF